MQLSVGCGDDVTGPTKYPLFDVWRVSSLVVNGENLLEGSIARIYFRLSDNGTYGVLVYDDTDYRFCGEPEASCGRNGTYSYTRSHITFSDGTESLTVSYCVIFDTLTISGSTDGLTIDARLRRTTARLPR
jgi:hypothetical protein